MKTILIFASILILSFTQNITAQTFTANEFYHSYKRNDKTTKLTIPGWAIDLGVAIAKGAVEDEAEKEALKLAKKIQKMRILVMEDENRVSKNDLRSLTKNLKKNKFEPLITIKDGESSVNILLREKNDRLKKLVILIHEKDEFLMLSLKTKIKIEDINHLIDLLEDDFDFEILPEEKDDEDTPMIRA